MTELLKKRLPWCLLACRFSVFIVFAVWSYDKLVRPEHGVDVLQRFYFLPQLPSSWITAFGLVELILCILLLLGLFKSWVRGFFLFISAAALVAPGAVQGYVDAMLVHAHPTILFFTGLCVFACSLTLYLLRDHDTLFTLSKSPQPTDIDTNNLTLSLFFCRLGVFTVFLVWTINKLIRPEHGVEIMNNHYLIGNVAETGIFLFGIAELVLCFLLIAGLLKRISRGFFLFISILSVATPRVLGGYQKVLFGDQSEPMIFLFSGFCMLACAITLYALRDVDTRFSLKTRLVRQ